MRVVIVGGVESAIAKAGVLSTGSGADIRCYTTIDAAIENILTGQSADILLVDAANDITKAVEQIAAARLYLPVIAYGKDCTPRQAAAAIRAGAKDFLPLPPDADLIAAVLSAVAAPPGDMVCQDPKMLEVVDLARQFAPANATVLITGESGTGKEVVARLVHQFSRRNNAPFVSVNCAAIPEHLLESELFGHEKGAFTGATSRRVGKFEEAHQGTLLLDEISEMDIRLQAKLLRAIQEREIDRVGGTKPVPVDIRLIATSNRDLDAAVKEGIFREDLLFRLNVLSLELPPLRERPMDIELLAEHFAKLHSQQNQLAERHLATETLETLRAHNWPGNVRELDNCIHRAVLLAFDGEICPAHLRLPTAKSQQGNVQDPSEFIGRTVADVEKQLILDTLDSTAGNRTRAAQILGISIRTLRNKLSLYGSMPEQLPS